MNTGERPATVTGERPDPDPLYVSEERRRRLEARAETGLIWLGFAALIVVVVVIGAVALWLIANDHATPRRTPDATSTALAYSAAPTERNAAGTA